jgi:hypothetical protein
MPVSLNPKYTSRFSTAFCTSRRFLATRSPHGRTVVGVAPGRLFFSRYCPNRSLNWGIRERSLDTSALPAASSADT